MTHYETRKCLDVQTNKYLPGPLHAGSQLLGHPHGQLEDAPTSDPVSLNMDDLLGFGRLRVAATRVYTADMA
jgi:hypothetical protein